MKLQELLKVIDCDYTVELETDSFLPHLMVCQCDIKNYLDY